MIKRERMHFYRPLTPRDVALQGLERGSFPGLVITRIRGKGLGVRATQKIPEGSYVTDYKYGRIYHTKAAKQAAISDYDLNQEGSYILEIVAKGKRYYLDATRRFNTYGR